MQPGENAKDMGHVPVSAMDWGPWASVWSHVLSEFYLPVNVSLFYKWETKGNIITGNKLAEPALWIRK